MSNTTTTTKARSALVSQPTEVQAAQNTFALAVKAYIEQPNRATQEAMETAQQNLYRVQDLYREGRKLRLAHAIQLRDQARQS